MKYYLKLSALFILLSTVVGCSTVGELEVSNIGDVKSDEVIVVGKIKLDPVVNEVEAPLYLSFPFNLFDNPDKYRNKIFITIGNKLIDISDRHLMAKGNTSVDLEKTFFIRVKKSELLYYSGGRIKTHMIGTSRPTFPGGIKYRLKPQDKAIYIGTIEYYRDFGEVEKVNLINEYSSARKEFIKKFGNKIKLRPVKPEKA